jgi:hypothetical protein
MRIAITMGLLVLLLLAACGRAAPSQPATAKPGMPGVTVFKPST